MTHTPAPAKPGPRPTPVSQPFWKAAADERLMLQLCQHCTRWVFFPRRRCPHCWADALEWRESTGRGRIASFTAVHRPEHPAFTADAPYVIALIDLDEGPRMLSNVIDADPQRLHVGDPVTLAWVHRADHSLPQFRRPEGDATDDEG